MKFALAYYLLLIYLTVILKPIIPLAEDSLEHCFAEAYHVATVHAKYGNNHLEKQEADTNDDNTTNNKNVKEDTNSSVHVFIVEQVCCSEINKLRQLYFVQSSFPISKIFLNIVIPPPKFYHRIYVTNALA